MRGVFRIPTNLSLNVETSGFANGTKPVTLACSVHYYASDSETPGSHTGWYITMMTPRLFAFAAPYSR